MNTGVISSRYAKALLKLVDETGNGEAVYRQVVRILKDPDSIPRELEPEVRGDEAAVFEPGEREEQDDGSQPEERTSDSRGRGAAEEGREGVGGEADEEEREEGFKARVAEGRKADQDEERLVRRAGRLPSEETEGARDREESRDAAREEKPVLEVREVQGVCSIAWRDQAGREDAGQ